MLAAATLVSDGLIARSTLSARGLPAAAVRWRRLAAPVAHASVSTTSLLADDATAAGGFDAAVVTDTLLDLGVYTCWRAWSR